MSDVLGREVTRHASQVLRAGRARKTLDSRGSSEVRQGSEGQVRLLSGGLGTLIVSITCGERGQ